MRQIEAKSNDDLRRALLRSEAPTTEEAGTLAPTGTSAPSPFVARCREAHEKLGDHLAEAASALKRARRTIHADHPSRPIITEASDQLESAKDQHQAIGVALDDIEA